MINYLRPSNYFHLNCRVVNPLTLLPITAAEFKKAVNDPENGLELFLSGRFEMTMKPSPTMK